MEFTGDKKTVCNTLILILSSKVLKSLLSWTNTGAKHKSAIQTLTATWSYYLGTRYLEKMVAHLGLCTHQLLYEEIGNIIAEVSSV